MIDLAHASRLHWQAVGTSANVLRAQYLLATAYAADGLAEEAIRHAETCLRLACETSGLPPFDRASTHGAAANAYACGGDLVRAGRHHQQALLAATEFDDPDDRLTFDRFFPPPRAGDFMNRPPLRDA